jgi:hypothetical protein
MLTRLLALLWLALAVAGCATAPQPDAAPQSRDRPGGSEGGGRM